MLSFLPFILGVLVLLVSSDLFIKSVTTLSRSIRISPLVIGSTIVAISTSLPELSISLLAAYRHDPQLAYANILGSNIINVLLILSLAIVFGNLRVGTTKTPRNALFSLISTLIFFSGYFFLPHRLFGGILLLTCGVYLALEYIWALKGREQEDKKRFSSQINIPKVSLIIRLLVSVLGIIFGGIWVVDSVEKLSVIYNLSLSFLGLTLTAVATSLPELLVTIISQFRHQEKIALGNIIGSNIINLTLIGGLLVFMVKPVNQSGFVWLFLIISSLVMTLLVFTYRGKNVPRILAFPLIIGFLTFIYSVLR